MFKVVFPEFREETYLENNPDVKEGIETSRHRNAFDHYLTHGIDENRSPQLSREPLNLAGSIDHFAVSESGYFTIFGWLGDEGAEPARWRLVGAEFIVEITPDAVFRHARKDVESGYRDGAYDYGFVIFGRTPSRNLVKQPVLVKARSGAAQFQASATPELWSDKRLLDTLLIRLKNAQSHHGLEAGVYQFLAGSSGDTMVSLFSRHARAHSRAPYVETFRPRPVSRSFLTVLFGSVEPILLQPLLFRSMGVDFGEWIYVCNSPEDGNSALRIGRMIAELYDVMITVVIMADNVGFGAANNAGAAVAQSDAIYVINPDVYPLKSQLEPLRRTLAERELGDVLWGGLLFYDDQNLMHSGMFVEQDVFIRGQALGPVAAEALPIAVKLVRVEHFDKGVPFIAEQWRRPLIVPAISGAVMAFDRRRFEKIGGFSTRYIYGHYEDADLSLRWAQENGPVAVDPDLRLVHLEGQGSKARGEQYRGAQLANRYLFSARYQELFQTHPELMTATRELPEAQPQPSTEA
ncbi:MAG TPA: galactosyltransferase-related protein [Rhodoblastus sp.]|nr:galactosyltransferase-related protein [Rhodoblastus sp.]